MAAVVPPLPEVDSFLSRIRELMMSSDAREVVHMLADAEVSRYKRRMEEGQRKYQGKKYGRRYLSCESEKRDGKCYYTWLHMDMGWDGNLVCCAMMSGAHCVLINGYTPLLFCCSCKLE